MKTVKMGNYPDAVNFEFQVEDTLFVMSLPTEIVNSAMEYLGTLSEGERTDLHDTSLRSLKLLFEVEVENPAEIMVTSCCYLAGISLMRGTEGNSYGLSTLKDAPLLKTKVSYPH